MDSEKAMWRKAASKTEIWLAEMFDALNPMWTTYPWKLLLINKLFHVFNCLNQ